MEDIIDEVVDQPLTQLRKYFTNEAWDLIMQIGSYPVHMELCIREAT